MAERISDIRKRLNYLNEVSERCNKARFPLGLVSLLGLSSTAVSASLLATPYASEGLVSVTAACTAATIFSVGALALSSKLSRDAEDEIFDLEYEYCDDLEKEKFMERISGYTR